VVPQALPAGARQGLAGFSFTRNEGGHPVFTVRAERSVDFKNGEGTKLDGVEVEMFGRAGDQHNLLRTKSCQYNSTSGNLSCLGQVEIELDAPPGGGNLRGSEPSPSGVHGRQPVYLETAGLFYNQQKSLVTSAARVRWRYGTASGMAVGLAYSTEDGELELKHEVTASLPVEQPARPGGAQAPAVLQLAAARLRYSSAEHQIDLSGPVQLREGARELNADQASVHLNSRSRLTAALLKGSVRAEDRSPRSLLSARAAALEAIFDPLTGDLRSLEASGGVEARSGQGPGRGTAQLAADRARVDFAGAHFHPTEGVASGNARVNLQAAAQPGGGQASATADQPSAPGPSQGSLRGEELDASELQFAFRPASGTLDRAHTVGPGRLVLIPSGAHEGRRVVTAGQFLMAFDGLGRLESMRGTAPTRIVFEPRPGAPAGGAIPESRADNLQAQLDPASAELERLEQSGHFELLDGDRRAGAERAAYSADGQIMTLTGKPSVTDPDARIQADRFQVHLATHTADGFGHVTSTHFGPWQEGAPGSSMQLSSSSSPPPGARPASAAIGGTQKEDPSKGTTNVLADRVFADRSLQYVRYEGHVRAWQGADVLESPSLDIYRADRRIVSGAGVVTSDLAPAPSKPPGAGRARPAKRGAGPGTPGGGATEPVTIRADRLEYFDLGRKAAYRGHVRMDASGATLEADRLDVYFTGSVPRASSQLDRAIADGHVTVVEPGRRAGSDHAEYFAAAGKVVMTGGPPALYDSEQGFTTGRSLTFFTHDDTLLVDGGSGTRVLSKRHLPR